MVQGPAIAPTLVIKLKEIWLPKLMQWLLLRKTGPGSRGGGPQIQKDD